MKLPQATKLTKVTKAIKATKAVGTLGILSCLSLLTCLDAQASFWAYARYPNVYIYSDDTLGNAIATMDKNCGFQVSLQFNNGNHLYRGTSEAHCTDQGETSGFVRADDMYTTGVDGAIPNTQTILPVANTTLENLDLATLNLGTFGKPPKYSGKPPKDPVKPPVKPGQPSDTKVAYGNLCNSKPVRQSGVASFYADVFNGRPTANGETFSNGHMTAAHQTLPFGTIVGVQDVEGHCVKVRINDRGPFVGGRVIDLSKAAYSQIEPLSTGLTEVTLHY
jgi:rare lipoprotein A